jgi:hypothetical protein
MHIEKNMFEKKINRVKNIKGKTKDNMKARIDIPLFCHRKNRKLIYDGIYGSQSLKSVLP